MIKRLLMVFGEPETQNPDGYLDEVIRVLKGYTETVQDEACTLLMKTHRGRQFPTPAQCRAACQEVEETRSPINPTGTEFLHPDWQPESFKKADTLIRSDLGRQAADEGWIGQLHDFCRKKHCLPMHHESGKLKQEARLFDDAYAEAQRMGNAALVRLGTAMLKKRDRHGRVTDGEVLA